MTRVSPPRGNEKPADRGEITDRRKATAARISAANGETARAIVTQVIEKYHAPRGEKPARKSTAKAKASKPRETRKRTPTAARQAANTHPPPTRKPRADNGNTDQGSGAKTGARTARQSRGRQPARTNNHRKDSGANQTNARRTQSAADIVKCYGTRVADRRPGRDEIVTRGKPRAKVNRHRGATRQTHKATGAKKAARAARTRTVPQPIRKPPRVNSNRNSAQQHQHKHRPRGTHPRALFLKRGFLL